MLCNIPKKLYFRKELILRQQVSCSLFLRDRLVKWTLVLYSRFRLFPHFKKISVKISDCFTAKEYEGILASCYTEDLREVMRETKTNISW